MISFLFWNTDRRPIRQLVAAMAREHKADIVILAEPPGPPGVMLPALNAASVDYDFPVSNCGRIDLYTRFSEGCWQRLREDKWFSLRRLRLPGRPDLLIAAAHLESRLRAERKAQDYNLAIWADEIRRAEDLAGHRRTVFIGDINMDPFDDGVVHATGLHAVMSRALARKGGREVKQRRWPFFYNPMWRFYGNRPPQPHGTFFRARGDAVSHFWHIFDQVLVRPELLDAFDEDSLRIVTRCGDVRLVDDAGMIDEEAGSDHLPLVFRLNL
jgi:endonuclease/exonuclease/phosphatase family metal-dependent hydrolase